MAVDLVAASHEKLASALRGVDTVVSFLPPDPAAGAGQVALADAAKSAGVKRFVLNSWAPAMPPRGVHFLREEVRVASPTSIRDVCSDGADAVKI